MTLFVNDLQTTVADLGTGGFTVTGTDLSSSAWREAFISPRSAFGTLLQFVETDSRWDQLASGITLDDVLADRVVWRDYVPCLRTRA